MNCSNRLFVCTKRQTSSTKHNSKLVREKEREDCEHEQAIREIHWEQSVTEYAKLIKSKILYCLFSSSISRTWPAHLTQFNYDLFSAESISNFSADFGCHMKMKKKRYFNYANATL